MIGAVIKLTARGALGAIVFDTTFGLLSGYHRVLDFLIMRIADGLMADRFKSTEGLEP